MARREREKERESQRERKREQQLQLTYRLTVQKKTHDKKRNQLIKESHWVNES